MKVSYEKQNNCYMSANLSKYADLSEIATRILSDERITRETDLKLQREHDLMRESHAKLT